MGPFSFVPTRIFHSWHTSIGGAPQFYKRMWRSPIGARRKCAVCSTFEQLVWPHEKAPHSKRRLEHLAWSTRRVRKENAVSEDRTHDLRIMRPTLPTALSPLRHRARRGLFPMSSAAGMRPPLSPSRRSQARFAVLPW